MKLLAGQGDAARSGRRGATIGALTAIALAGGIQTAHAAYVFQDIINNGDPTFNQELGINNAGEIAGYFGSGAPGHPNQGYTVVAPYAQANFTPENVPGSVQTQVTGLNNVGTTVGFFSNSNMGVGLDSNFGFASLGGGFVLVHNPNTAVTPPTINQLLGVNDSNVAAGFYVDAAGVTHGYTYSIGSAVFFKRYQRSERRHRRRPRHHRRSDQQRWLDRRLLCRRRRSHPRLRRQRWLLDD